jgi:hypothetical protein
MRLSFRLVHSGLVLASLCGVLSAQTSIHSAPIEIINNKPFVMVTVNGAGPYRFVIDTGTGGDAFVSTALAERLRLPVVGQAKLRDPSGVGGRRAPMVRIDSIEVAGVEFKAVKAVEHHLGDAEQQCDGLLGFTLFREHLLTLDFPNHRITLASGALAPDGEHSVLSFRMPEGVPIIPIHIDDFLVDAQIDSGGQGLSLPENLAQRLRFRSVPTIFGKGESLVTRFQIKSARLASDIHLAGYTFDHPFVEINPAFPLTNIGSYPMQSFALTFDQKNRLIRFTARRRSLRLAATPTPLNIQNAPADRPDDPLLVPVG